MWELFQNHWIRNAENTANEAAIEGRSTRHYVSALERRVEALEFESQRLLLAAMALSEILRDDFGVTPERLESKLREIDARDGTVDGKVTATNEPCPSCERLIRAGRPSCFYCGARLPAKPALG